MAELPRTYEPKEKKCDYINLHNILLQPSMVNELKKLTPDINLLNYPIDNTNNSTIGNLQRIEEMKKAFDKKTPLECVDLKLIREAQPEKSYTPWGKKGVIKIQPATPALYDIVNGRHRVVLSIAYGMTHIPANIK